MVYVALLRAINLGRVNRVPMAGLRTALTEAGFGDVTTHLQSGNVVFRSRKRSDTSLAKEIEELVVSEFGVDAVVMVRGADQLAKIVRTNPLARGRTGEETLHVAFLKSRPNATATRALAGRSFDDDEFVIRGTEIYLRYPNGVAGSKMNTALFEGALGTPGTVRTWKVVSRLNELARTV
ncbi:MAG TPA: DUF1697 domain-containing protein [Acidimicrobiia bacterium]|nr:DUF1697 domain-containing protein [Acidimicrobiia bacterium]